MDGVYYRYQDYLESSGSIDITGEYVFGTARTRVRLLEFPVLKTTPCGAWINDGGRRFVRSGTRKCYAHPTLEEALASFIARKARQQSIYLARAKQAEEAILWAKVAKAPAHSLLGMVL